MDNNGLVIALIIAVLFMIAFPVVFSLIKKDSQNTYVEQIQPSPPPQPSQPPVVIQQPPVILPPPIIIAPNRGAYSQGWADANRGIPPCERNNPDYMRGYRDFCHRHPRPGFIFHFDIK